jgi:hypothetical protein
MALCPERNTSGRFFCFSLGEIQTPCGRFKELPIEAMESGKMHYGLGTSILYIA